MNDLISKEVAIDTLKAVRDLVWEVDIPSPTVPEYIEHHEQMESIMRNIDILTEKIIKMPSAQRWIPCSERMPDAKGEYLVVFHPCYWDNVEPGVKVGIDSFRGKTTWAKKKYQRVIAWMPLPEPYKEDRDD